MNNKEIIKYALVNSLWTILYIILIGTLLFSAERVFPQEPSAFIPIVMLLLFVFSATVTGALILGRPILWYLDGKKQEAISLLLYTIAIFFVVILMILFVLYTLK